jgi:cytidylate kinase
MERYQVSEKNAQDMIKRIDKSRSSYYNSTTGDKWGDAKVYDLCINSSRLGIDGVVELLDQFIKHCL